MHETSKGLFAGMLRKMMEIRFFEEKVFELYGQNLVPGTIHLYAGEEAVAVGICSALRTNDYVTSTHRGHGHCIAKGADLKRVMAEVLGKESGYCRGKGGSMHIADFKIGMLGATAVVGAGLPIAVGAALSAQLRKTDQVVACFFGEGASNQGTFHESINMASVWRLPVVFVCENNLYAMGTRQSQVMGVESVAERASGYGIPGVSVDGNDVILVYETAVVAVDRARRGKGGTLIECRTYRRRGHSRADPARYRPKEEVEEWLRRDPLRLFQEKLLHDGVLSSSEVKQAEQQVAAEIEEAAEFAKRSSYPAPEEALEDVYAE